MPTTTRTFADTHAEVNANRGVLSSWGFAVSLLVTWPLDLWTMAGDHERLVLSASLRVTLLVWTVITGFSLYYTTWWRSYPVLLMAPLSALSTFVGGYGLGRLGGLDTPWACFVWFVPLLCTMTRGGMARALSVALIATACWAGLWTAEPDLLHQPHHAIWLTVLLYVCGVSVWAGGRAQDAEQRDWENTRSIQHLAATLEARVAEQSEELRQLLATEDQRALERESSLASAIHDDFGQTFAALRYAYHWARRTGTVASLDEVGRRLGESADTLKRVLRRLPPPLVVEEGLVPALSTMLEDFGQVAGIEGTVACEPADLVVPSDVAVELYRVIQEATHNSVKHGRATQVSVQIHKDDGHLVVAVRDNGSGIPRGATPGRGLLGTQERIRRLHGATHWSSPAGGGFLLEVEVPVGDSHTRR